MKEHLKNKRVRKPIVRYDILCYRIIEYSKQEPYILVKSVFPRESK